MHVFSLVGIPVRLHWSFLAIAAGLVGWALVGSGPFLAAQAFLLGTALFGSVVLHELGHALAARRYGIETAHITLYPFGGVAAIHRMPDNPREELVIALAGPAVNFVLVAALGIVSSVLHVPWLAPIIGVNLAMGVFNLIPAFPMDGGRVLRALLVQRMGWFRATKTAIFVGRGFAWAFLLIGVFKFIPSLVMIAVFLHVALAAETRRLTLEAFANFRPRWRTNEAYP